MDHIMKKQRDLLPYDRVKLRPFGKIHYNSWENTSEEGTETNPCKSSSYTVLIYLFCWVVTGHLPDVSRGLLATQRQTITQDGSDSHRY